MNTLVAETGEVLLSTALQLRPGDQFIDPGNDIWAVSSVEPGGRAVARRVAKLSLSLSRKERVLLAHSGPAVLAASTPQPPGADVVIYHSHSDEAYIPTEGADSVEDTAGIYRVGASLAAALQAEGIRVDHRLENHNPRDGGAYVRSRRTVLAAMAADRPAAVFDVHRDAAPGTEYRTTLEGKPVSRVLIVIGRSNPTHETNTAFAKLIKARADELHPGLVRGIFLGTGNYNQDTFSRNILLEAGSQEVPGDEAEAGIAMLASAIAPVLRETGLLGSPAAQAENHAAGRTAVWVVTALVVLGGGFFILINGGWRPALAKLGRWREELWDPRRGR